MAPAPGIHITVQVDDFTRDLLTGAGWTPPGETPPARQDYVSLKQHGDALNALELKHTEGWRRQQERHRAALDALAADQRRAFDRLRHQHQEELDRQAKEHHVALREARKKSSADVRAEVAEEIARDLEKPREWRISPEEPAPWARVARAHAKGLTLPFPNAEWWEAFRTP